MQYIDETVPSSHVVWKQQVGGTIDGWGSHYAYVHHLAGPPGPRGGLRTMCGSRVRYPISVDIPVDRVIQAAQVNHRVTYRSESSRWYYDICSRCAHAWGRSVLRESA